MSVPASVEAVFRDPDKAIRYHALLAGRGVEWGLIGPREVDRLWERHILNSVALADLMPEGSTVVDVGSGAGLPGIPLALARPDLRITLLEPLQRRADFLVSAVDEFGVDVDVVRARAEEHRVRYDVVTGRAVAPLTKLIGWCLPLMGEQMLWLKGRSAPDEVQAASSALTKAKLGAEVLSCRAHPSSEPTTVVRLTRR